MALCVISGGERTFSENSKPGMQFKKLKAVTFSGKHPTVLMYVLKVMSRT